VVSSKEFGQLTNRTIRVMRSMTASEILSVLISLIDLKIPPQVLIFQSLLQLLRTKINDFTTRQLSFLNYLLNRRLDPQQTDDPLVKAIMMAVPMVVSIKICNKEFPTDSTKEMIRILGMAVYDDMGSSAVNSLLQCLTDCEEPINEADYIPLVHSLTHRSVSQSTDIDHNLAEGLMEKSLSAILDCYHGDKLVNIYKRSFLTRSSYYSQPFFDKVHETIAADMESRPLDEIFAFTRTLNSYGHISFPFLNALEARILQEKDTIRDNMELPVIYPLKHMLLPYMAWKPSIGWPAMLDILMSPERIEFFMKNRTDSYLRTGNYYSILEMMALIGQYRFSAFKHCLTTFKGDTHRQIPNEALATINLGLKFDSTLDPMDMNEENSHLIRQLLYPILETILPFLNHQKRFKFNERVQVIKDCLVRGLGGEDFVRSGVWTRDGSFIDLLVVMRKGNYPVAVGKESEQITFMDEINVPQDGKLLAVLPVNHLSRLRSPPYLRPRIDFYRRMLVSQGFHVLMVNTEDFEKMSVKEQLPFLMREISQALE